MKSTQKIYILTILAVVAVAALWAAPLMAQTKTARGIAPSASAIGVVLPEFATLESEVNETRTLAETIEGCGEDNRFYQASTGDCRTTDPVEIEFSNSPTQLSIQRPDSSTAVYNLDGVAGTATVGGGGGGPDDDDPPENCTAPWGGTVNHGSSVRAYSSSTGPCGSETRVCEDGTLSGSFTARSCRVRMVCARNGNVWPVGSLGEVQGRFGTEFHYCCEGVPESEAGRIAGIAVQRIPSPSMLCP